MRPSGTAAVASVVVAHQLAQAQTSQNAVAEMLAEQEIDAIADAFLELASFTTSAIDLDQMIAQVTTDFEFDRLVESIVTDAARATESVAIAVRPNIFHVRFVNPPCCARCAILAGHAYKWSTGFERHPNCFPAGTVVSGPRSLRASRRWYEGELLTLRTASGKKLSVTPNHPILTGRGWVPAHLLVEGDDVISRAGGDRTKSLLIPDEDHVPTPIEDVWRSGRVNSLARVPVASKDFHGDGLGSCDVDVVSTDRLLGNGKVTPISQVFREKPFAVRPVLAIALSTSGVSSKFTLAPFDAAHGSVRGGGASGSLLGSKSAIQDVLSLAGVPNCHASLVEPVSDCDAAYAEALGERELALSSEVGRHDGGVVQHVVATRWDAPPVAFSMESRAAYAEIGQDLRSRLSGQVTRDRLVEKTGIEWSGHVYNLTSSEGWYDAGGFIVSNCDCSMIPTTVASPLVQDRMELVRSGQVTGLSKADLQALADGADLAQVVNIRSKKAGLLEAGHALRRGNRPTPAGIYRLADGDREKALELLKRYGFIR